MIGTEAPRLVSSPAALDGLDGAGLPGLSVRVIERTPGWRAIDFEELWRFRDLFWFLVWRDVKSRYAQSVLGLGWAIIQPVATMIVFTVVFGNLAQISSDGVPYALFSFAGLLPWTFFSDALSGAGSSLVSATGMLSKVYFPRLIIPIAPMLGKLVDFAVASVILAGLMVFYRVPPTLWAVLLPVLVLLMLLTAGGVGMVVTSLSVQYRDVKFALPFVVQLLMYAAPVVYPASLVPARFRLLYGLNPMAGVVEGFRAALLGARPMPWDLLVVGSITAVIVAVVGMLYFRRMERIFADVA